jgi:DNA-binding transcriptional LysR family regulator
VELRALRYFVALAEELHFGRAAQRLSMTQPPLSQALAKLERELGVRLIERTRRKVELTVAGGAFLDEARATLARAAQAVELAQRAQRGEVGRLAVGYLAATAYTLLPLALRAFRSDFPGVKLELRELTIPQQHTALLRGDIDVAILRPPVSEAELAAETILAEPFVLALPARHPLRALRRVPVKRLAGEPFVMFPRQPGLVFHDLVMDFCLRAGFTPRVAQEAYQTHTVVGLVAACIGVALVPASAQKLGLAGVAYRSLREATPQSRTAIAWRRADASPAIRAFLEAARRAAKQVNSAAEES